MCVTIARADQIPKQRQLLSLSTKTEAIGRRPGSRRGKDREGQDKRVHVATSPPVRIGEGMLHGGEV
jgi:hypothetical protein